MSAESSEMEALRRRLRADPDDRAAFLRLDSLARRSGTIALRYLHDTLLLPDWLQRAEAAGTGHWRWFQDWFEMARWAQSDPRVLRPDGDPSLRFQARLSDLRERRFSKAILQNWRLSQIGLGLALHREGLEIRVQAPTTQQGLASPLLRSPEPPALVLELSRGALGSLVYSQLGPESRLAREQALDLRPIAQLGVLAVWQSVAEDWREVLIFQAASGPLSVAPTGRELIPALEYGPRIAARLTRNDSAAPELQLEALIFQAPRPRLFRFASESYAEILRVLEALFHGGEMESSPAWIETVPLPGDLQPGLIPLRTESLF